jgi:K+-transporting ATPase ATPase C chain
MRRNNEMTRQLRTAALVTVVMMAITGIAYPLGMTGVAQVLFPDKADGSLITKDGVVVGSELLGQSFVDPETGATLPGYFRGRPSAAFDDPTTGITTSSGSNYGPTNKALIERVTADVTIVRAENGLGPDDQVPVDLVTASASGFDPDISPASAEIQIARVAAQRGLSVVQVRDLVAAYTSGRTLGFMGEPRVNVLKLNLALDDLKPMPAAAATPGA